MIYNKNLYNVAVIASAIMIMGGLVAIPAFSSGHEAQSTFPKIKNFVKHVVGKIFHRDSTGSGGGGCTTC